MKRLLFFVFLLYSANHVFSQFSDTTQLNQFIQDTIKDRRPEKVTAAQIQKSLLGLSHFLTPGSANAFNQNGNNFGSTAIIGTRDNNHFDIYTNNIRRMRFTNNGNLLINVPFDAGYKVDILGTVRIQAEATVTAGISIENGLSGTGLYLGNYHEIYPSIFAYTSESEAGFEPGTPLLAMFGAGYGGPTTKRMLTFGTAHNYSGTNYAYTAAFGSGTGDLLLRINSDAIITQTPGQYNDASAIFQIDAGNKGFLPPRMTTSAFTLIPNKAKGLEAFSTTDNGKLWFDGTGVIGFRYNRTTSKFQGFDGTTWIDLN